MGGIDKHFLGHLIPWHPDNGLWPEQAPAGIRCAWWLVRAKLRRGPERAEPHGPLAQSGSRSARLIAVLYPGTPGRPLYWPDPSGTWRAIVGTFRSDCLLRPRFGRLVRMARTAEKLVRKLLPIAGGLRRCDISGSDGQKTMAYFCPTACNRRSSAPCGPPIRVGRPDPEPKERVSEELRIRRSRRG
ncbi:Urea amidolyase related protein [Cereibacter sphaeroides KD131]|nr:Urea amidolyase related protein [Cereibacter sphaeroides KD131]